MPYADDTLEILPEETWSETPWGVEIGRAHVPVAPEAPEGRFAGFLHSLVASMALLRRSSRQTGQPHAGLSATEALAQHYPQLYLRVMCG